MSHFWEFGCSLCYMVAPLFQDRVHADVLAADVLAAPAASGFSTSLPSLPSTPDISTAGFELVVGQARDIAATLTLTDYDADGLPAESDLHRVGLELPPVLSAELDGAAANLGILNGKILIAALGRAVARTIGRGVLAVDVDAHIIALDCVMPAELDATEMIAHVCSALVGSTGRQHEQPLADLSFRCAGPVSADEPLAGHALELRAYRCNGLVQIDFWYDARRFEAYTIEELAEQFPQALIEITSEAVPEEIDAA